MTLRKLPAIKAFDPSQTQLAGEHGELSFAPDPEVLAKFHPNIRAGDDDKKNDIGIYEVIGEDFWTGGGVTSKRIAAALRSIGNQPVNVYINSPGGDFFEGAAIYTLLREHPAEVTVKVVGMAASAASVIAMAGDRIEISDVGFIFIHDAWAIAIGNRHDMREAADVLEPFDEAMAALYAARSNLSEKEAMAAMDRETWYTPKKAIDAGLADAMLESAITEDAPDDAPAGDTPEARLALRRVDAALRKMGIPRGDRRETIQALRTTPSAVPPNGDKPGAVTDPKPSAGEAEAGVIASLGDLAGSIRSAIAD